MLGDQMRECGLNPEAVRGKPPYIDAKRVKGYLELHIEQGPLLEHRAIPIGVVTSIRGIIVEMDNFAAELASEFEHKYVDHGAREAEYRA